MNFRKIAQQSSLYFLSNLASRAVGFLMIPVYTHHLTPAEYGMVELLELCIQIVTIVVGIQALGGALIRIFYEYDDENSRRTVVSSAILCTVTVGIVITAVACVSADWLSAVLFKSPTGGSLIRVAFVAMFFGNLAEIALIYYRLRDRVGVVVAYSLTQLVVALTLNIYFIAFKEMGVWGFIWSKLATAGIGGTILMIAVFRNIKLRWVLEPTRRIVAFALPLILTGGSLFAIHFADRFFIAEIDNLGDVGIYSLAYKFGFLVSYLVGEPFSRVWNVNLYGSLAADSWRQETAKAGRYLTFFLFLTGLSVCLLIPRLMPFIAKSSFGAAATVIPILVMGYIMREIGDFFKAVLYVNKRTYLVSNVTLFCAVLNCALNMALIKPFGIQGAAWATLLTWAVYMAGCWMYAEQEHEIKFGLGPFSKVCVLAGVLYGLGKLHGEGATPALLAVDTVLITIFCYSMFALNYLPRQDWDGIAGYVSRFRLKPW